MNITELARELKITTAELKDVLPELGFDIGQRAIKIDDRLARKIIENWQTFKKVLEKKKVVEKNKIIEEKDIQVNLEKVINLPPIITVRDFAAKLNLPVSTVMKELMKNGILASLNERIDFETAAIIAEDFGFKVEKADEQESEEIVQDKIKELIENEDKSKLESRPPVVVVMGHVDHGKTKLLDAIRKSHVMESEVGGITQHIGAYQAVYKDCLITFIDTPGHEAFTAMRSRGAKVADIAILVVAADDGVQPQTKEAIKIIEAAKIPFIVAINKIDKPEANIEKIKQELSGLNLIPEDWGGKTICVPISAKMSKGIGELLDMVLLVANLEKDKIVANPNRPAVGTVIESHLDKGEGAVATILVQSGTLRQNDNLVINNTFYGRARALKDFRGNFSRAAAPGMPIKILGFKVVPQVGDILEVVADVKSYNKKIKSIYAKREQIVIQKVDEEEEQKKKKLSIILKTDVLGSLEAIFAALEKFNYPDIEVEIMSRGLGNITDAEILQAEATGALVFGFNVLITPSAKETALEKNVKVKTFNIIYDLINEVKVELENLLEPEIVRTDLGKVQVLAIFRTEPNSMIVGGKVFDGKITFTPNSGETLIKVLRDKKEIGSGILAQLQCAKSDVREVCFGQECGIKFKGKSIIAPGDILEVYREEKKFKKLG